MPSLPTHPYQPDLTAPANQRGEHPCTNCPVPQANRVHDVPDTSAEQAEQRRRIGEDA